MIFGTIINALSFGLQIVKEAVSIKRRKPNLYVSDITIIADEAVNPESFYIDCFIANNSDKPISISRFGIVRASGKEYKCAVDDFGTISGYTVANTLPILIEPGTMQRIIIEYNYDDNLRKFMSRIAGRDGKTLYLRAHTNTGPMGTCFFSYFNHDMESWYYGRLQSMRQAT